MQKQLLLLALLLSACASRAQSTRILDAKKKLVYEVRYRDSAQKINIIDTLRFEITNKAWRYDSLRQRTVIWRRQVNKIKPAFKNKIYCLASMRVDSAGAAETEEEYRLNLPSSDYFAILQIAPVARFIKSARVNDVYNAGLKLGPGWGIYENLELTCNYKATRRGSIKLKTENYLYLQIDAVSSCKFGTNTVTYLYSEQLGCIGADFRFYNGVKLQMQLLSVD